MKGPTLQKTAALSVALHLTVLILSLLMLRQSNRFVAPSPYIVDLVSPAAISRNDTGGSAQTVTKTATPLPKVESKPAKERKEDKFDKKIVEDRLHEIASKKKIKQIVEGRVIVSVRGGSEQTNSRESGRKIVGDLPLSGSAYTSKIASEIGQEINYPDTGKTQLTTIVFVKIMKDGTIQIQRIEEKSGDRLFDSAALKAIVKASPVTPPPHEMELELRLHPWGKNE